MNNKIVICMGSSCFARGNDRHLELIEEYIEEHQLDVDLELSGCRCMDKCTHGPNIIVNGKTINDVDEIILMKLLRELK